MEDRNSTPDHHLDEGIGLAEILQNLARNRHDAEKLSYHIGEHVVILKVVLLSRLVDQLSCWISTLKHGE